MFMSMYIKLQRKNPHGNGIIKELEDLGCRCNGPSSHEDGEPAAKQALGFRSLLHVLAQARLLHTLCLLTTYEVRSRADSVPLPCFAWPPTHC